MQASHGDSARHGGGRTSGTKRKRAKGSGLVVAYDETARRCVRVRVYGCHTARLLHADGASW